MTNLPAKLSAGVGLETLDGGLEARVEGTKLTLKETTDLDEIKQIHDMAQAAEVYAKAQLSREAYLAAAEIKLWAERRAGEIRRQLPRAHGIPPRFDRQEAKRLRKQGLSHRQIGEALGVNHSAIGYAERKGWADGIKGVPLREFDDRLGVSSALAYNWERLSEIPEPRFVELLAEAKEREGSMTASGIARRDNREYVKRLEPGIYQTRDGRLAIKWKKDGVSRYKTMPTDDLTKARKALARARGSIKERQVRGAATVGDAYALVRRALQVLDTVHAQLEPEAREAASAAIGHLHKAEDELVRASNTFPHR